MSTAVATRSRRGSSGTTSSRASAFHPDLAERFELRIDDRSVFLATRAYLRRSNRMSVWRDMGGEYGRVPGPQVREVRADRPRDVLSAVLEVLPAVRRGDALLQAGRAHGETWPGCTACGHFRHNLDITTPRGAGEESAVVKRSFIDDNRADGPARSTRLPLGPRRPAPDPPVRLPAHPGIALVGLGRVRRAASASTIGSTIPTVVGYPLPHTILEPALGRRHAGVRRHLPRGGDRAAGAAWRWRPGAPSRDRSRRRSLARAGADETTIQVPRPRARWWAGRGLRYG